MGRHRQRQGARRGEPTEFTQHAAGRGLRLHASGWRVTSADGHHKESLEAACAIAGVPVGVHDDMDAVRDLRNDQYKGRAPTNEDVALALRSMEIIAPKLLEALGPFLR